MKVFLLKLSIFGLLLIGVDTAFGYLFKKIRNNGDSKYDYIFFKANEDILILGSSRAYRHYNPMIIEDSLGMSCYNCGVSAMGILHNYVLLSVISKRHNPKLIIYDFYPQLDLYKNGDNHIYLAGLKPYKEIEIVSCFVDLIDKKEKYKNMSQLYCYNRICNEIFLSCFVNEKESSSMTKGFVSLDKKFNEYRAIQNKQVECKDEDPFKVMMLEKLIRQKNQDVKMLICISPLYHGIDSKYLNRIKTICQENNILCVDFSNNPEFYHNKQFFYDNIHMNASGANAYTKDLIPIIKGVVKN